jgi:hypothetical protein
LSRLPSEEEEEDEDLYPEERSSLLPFFPLSFFLSLSFAPALYLLSQCFLPKKEVMVARIRTMKVRLPSCERKKVLDREGEEEEEEEMEGYLRPLLL